MIEADRVHSTPPINTSALPDGLARQEREREKALKRVAKLRQKAEDEIVRLLALDASDPYAATERTRDLVGPVEDEAEVDTADAEPALGSVTTFDAGESQERWADGNRDDRETECDDEGVRA